MERPSKQLFNAALRTGQPVVSFVAPLSKGKSWGRTFTRMMMMVTVLSSLSFLGATVFAEPAIAEVEEMGGLMHFPNDANFVL
ncbi:MAG TPA: hypothetical protein VI306_01510 [Pyrinomonadaceae bacterium]